MANTFQVKRSAVAGKVPLTTDLALGELAINTYDGKLYMKKNVGGTESIVDVTAGGMTAADLLNTLKTVDGAGSGLDADLLDGLSSGSFFRADAANSVDARLAAGDGRGLRFWDNDAYKIYMSAAGNATWGGRLDATSDYNLYFRIGGGTNRGFVFENGTTPVFQIESTGQVRAEGGVIATAFTGSGAGLTNLNAGNLTSGTIPDARLSGTYTGVSITGNAATATTLQTARTITLGGDLSGSVSFDGSANVTLTATILDDSHNHTIANVDGLQTALNAKLNLSGGTLTGALTGTTFNATTASGAFQGVAADAATTPSFTWTDDLDTGMWRVTTDQIGFTTAGVNRVTISSAGVSVAGDVTSTSDARLKTNIEPIRHALHKVLTLRGVVYDRTDIELRQTGVIAQEVEEVLPEAVGETGGFKTVAYGNMVGLLIEAIKELAAKVERLEAAQ